jgi:hypothetical protein
MTRKSIIVKYLSLGLALVGIIVAAASQAEAQQRDPFRKPGYQIPRVQGPGGRGVNGVVVPGLPSIEQRIDYFKRLREQAAVTGTPLPRVTSVLTLDEMAVTGIFRTPRGYAAMVEAVPIKLSYTIYPGEKFFDGQLVAVEENRLVFRKVTRGDKGKFVASVENKPLRQYSSREEIQGTVPVESTSQRPMENTASSNPTGDVKTVPVKMVSPLDEMNKQPIAAEPKKGEKPAKNVKDAKDSKDPKDAKDAKAGAVKIARNKK